jgi:hypothetical protein
MPEFLTNILCHLKERVVQEVAGAKVDSFLHDDSCRNHHDFVFAGGCRAVRDRFGSGNVGVDRTVAGTIID